MEINGKVHCFFEQEEWRDINGFEGLYQVSNKKYCYEFTEHRQRWINEFSPKVTQVCELKKGRTQMGFRKIKVTDPACEQYEKNEEL